MKKWRVITGIIVVFLLGALSGGAFIRIILQPELEHEMRGGPSKAAGEVIVKRLSRDLNLDAAQQSQLTKIFEDTRKEMLNLERRMYPQADAILNRAQARTDGILRPDQRGKFDKIVMKERARMEQRARAADEEVRK
jgi:hypothetical protein